ncbi:MAG: 30S ribosomal protein S1 [Deltaproteobacteria bacterium]|nr:30S ribosomal protein S1 [Deltaproteobacteria bacterium]MBW1932834.1 30S ribosomal protein S1 [Deltaproteobacteria bacterium]MBW1964581.1 30S ribosomal protein S1 [Deltaproteobacteria bacterium]MBW2350016.1 30S ribosomal protein S1 [Deltaproteobacteria bacterium]
MEKVACEVTQEQTLTADSDEEAEISQEDSQVLEENVSSEEAGDMGAFEDLFEQSLRTFQEGEILEGTVVRIDKESVMIDVGYKSEGLIPIREFRDEEGEITVSPGDTAEVLLERWDPDEGMLRLSHSKALRRQVWEEIAKAFEAETPVKATVSSRVKGGLSVRIGDRKGGVTAFLPFSQIDLMPVRDPEALSNQTIECAVLKCNRRRENVVVSRRFLLEKEMAEKRVNTLASLEEGQVREGDVKNITDYGVFVDLGGIDGLLHITDMSWGRVEHPSRLFNVGDTIKVKILTFDRDSEKVSLGAKQLTEDPWSRVEEKYPVGEKVTGKVVSLTDYGVFIELEEGVEGLIHVSEMSWTKRIRHPSQIVNVGDIVEAIVLKVDSKAQRISLGLKQIEPNPWDLVQDRYPIGTVIEGSVKNITEFGLFIGIEEGIDGLVHISDLSWSKRIKHPNEIYKKGETIEAVVLNIDKEKERFSLGVKQLHPDPWESAPERYPVDSQVTGKVTNVTDFGVFVELEEGVEGLIHISELGPGKIKTPVGMFQVGDEISAKVIHVAPLERRIGLSVKRISEDEERSHFDKYNGVERSAGNTLGSLLQEELVQRNRARSEEDKDQKE